MTPTPWFTNLKEQSRAPPKEDAMHMKLVCLAPILGAAALATAISAAPFAAATPDTKPPGQQQQACVGSGPATVCQSPGNTQINDAPPPVQFFPYGGEAFLL
jgi:hypothetical protein